jgi:hypothetical protein
MVAANSDNLARAISEGIAIRGIYALVDERLDIICGPGTLDRIDSPDVKRKMSRFATVHGWCVTRYRAGFVRWPRAATPVRRTVV